MILNKTRLICQRTLNVQQQIVVAASINNQIQQKCRNIWTKESVKLQQHQHQPQPQQPVAIPTSLYDFHIKNKGKMINFGGYLLPVQYADLSITGSHLHTRENASIFDVSHMLQTEIQGADSTNFIETLCTADVRSMKDGSGTLTIFTNKFGGILDDLIITKIQNNYLYIVSNAARREADMKLIMKGLEKYKVKYPNADVNITFYDINERSLLALQGPKSEAVLQSLVKDVQLNTLYFMESVRCNVADVDCRVTRCGYTGEDGFEISLAADKGVAVASALLKEGGDVVKLAGLGARDSLRLEAGLCLYGNDIDEKTTPVEAGLTWLVAKRRRVTADFPGVKTILNQIKNGVQRKRVGILSQKGPPARSNTDIYVKNGLDFFKIGTTTSGCPSPSMPGNNIAMGYVSTKYSQTGLNVLLSVRDKFYPAEIVKMPFIKTHYYVRK